MPDGDLMQGVAGQEGQQQQDMLQRLMGQALRPRKTGPQPQPEMVASSMPRQYDTTKGIVHNLFGMIMTHSQREKEIQLAHATSRLKNIADAITDSYENAEGLASAGKIGEDQVEQVAHQMFQQHPVFQAMQSKEGLKDLKQMQKLMQQDMLNPEKNKTVWHEALSRVVAASGAEKMMKGLRQLMGAHKDKMAEEVRKSGEQSKAQAGAREFGETMFKGARPQPTDVSKMLPSAISAAGADVRQRERLLHDTWKVEQQEKFASSIDAIKDPRLKQLARGIQLQTEGDEEGAKKVFDNVSKAYAATRKPDTMNLNSAINDLVNADTPEKRAAAQRWLDAYQKLQSSILQQRGLAFGMGRLYNWYNQETGETAPMNGFQAQQALAKGESWTMTSPVPVNLLLPAQQIIRSMALTPDPETGKNLRESLLSDMDVFDNSTDRAIISRVLRENPSVYAQDPSTIGIWLDANLTDKLSPEGQRLVRDVKTYAEVFNRSASLTGQTRTEMNTMMLLALLPNERTPSKAYAIQQLQSSFNYLDAVVQAPLLGGGKLGGGKPAKAASQPTQPSNVIKVDPKDMN